MKRVLVIFMLLLLAVFFVSMVGNTTSAALAQETDNLEITSKSKPDRPVPDKPIPYDEPGDPSQTGSYRTEVPAVPEVINNRSDSTLKLTDTRPNSDTVKHNGGIPGLYPDQLETPDSCGVPLGGPFGKDVEILLNDIQYQLEPGWYPQAGIPCDGCAWGSSNPSSDIAATPLDSEKIAAVWREGDDPGHKGELYYNIWDATIERDAWDPVAFGGPFSNADYWGGSDGADKYRTIHSADIDGDGIDELLGRADAGMWE